jgi:hypothetical protein
MAFFIVTAMETSNRISIKVICIDGYSRTSSPASIKFCTRNISAQYYPYVPFSPRLVPKQLEPSLLSAKATYVYRGFVAK